VDPQYAIGRINPAARRLLGVHGTATGQDFIHLAEVFPSSSLRTLIDAALAGKVASGTFEIEAPDDTDAETRFISVRARPRRPARLAGAARQPTQGAVIELIDVSDREHESRLRERIEARLEKSRATVRRLRRANEELTELADELRFLNDGLQLAGEDAQTGREELETLNEEFQATNEELEAVNEELTASVEELRATNEQLALRTGELKEQALELEAGKRDSDEDRARLRSVLASLGDAVVAVDHDGATVATNPAYDRLLQAAGPEFTPRDVAGAPIPPPEWPQSRAARGESFQMEFAIWTPRGAHQWYEAVAEPLVLPDRTWGGVVTIRDISERTMRISLERLMAAASHELRTPLAALHGYLQLVERHHRDAGPSTVGGYATQALTQARQMGVLLDLLFDVSRVRSGQLTLDRRELDFVAVAERAIDTVRAVAGAPPIALAAPRGRVMVLGDPTRLEQVLVNVIGNAAEHARTPRIDVAIRKTRGSAEAEIRDFGVGMDLERMPDLFEPYRSSPAGPGRPAAGLGLGLFLSREIMLAHGGMIEIRSDRDAGTTVKIALPVLAPHAADGVRTSRSRRAPSA
jgi:two-component system CheB/CheR fusion protein